MNSAIHEHIRMRRAYRGLTQAQVAAAFRPPRSEVWVRKLEAGERQADPRISVLEELARILDVSLAQLLSDDAPTSIQPADSEDDPALLRAVLLAPHRPTATVSDPSRVLRQAAWGFDAFQSGHYINLLHAMPDLVVAARALPRTPEGARAAYRVHHLAATVLMKYGGGAAAWHAADRAVDFARASGDPVAVALAAQIITYTLISIGEAATGLETVELFIEELAKPLSALDHDGYTALGMLWLKGAVAAAEIGDARTAQTMLSHAAAAAEHVPLGANRWRTGYDALNVRLHIASVEHQLGHYGEAARAAESIPGSALVSLPRERRAHHKIEYAEALAALSRIEDALSALLAAEADSPQEVHTRPAALALITKLLAQHVGRPPSKLSDLAARSGLAQP
jgi:transcriptional regulator with XRE-family HTH domain